MTQNKVAENEIFEAISLALKTLIIYIPGKASHFSKLTN